MTIRERLERLEREQLSPYATLSAESRGRQRAIEPDPVRTAFQRDRDRIIHLCRAFRRLAHKTQVFIAPREDHLRTRLSHTLEVSQIARTISKALRLNEDLTEAISLGHDVGHTPFGHAGEWALDEAYRRWDPQAAFAHAEHSVRVLTCLEREGRGLNLTYETIEGVAAHSKGAADTGDSLAPPEPVTLEAMVVRLSDRIAYLNHDLDDCLRSGLLQPGELPASCPQVLGERHSDRVGTMVEDVIARSDGKAELSMSARITSAMDDLKDFLFQRIYLGPPILPAREQVHGIINRLFDLYMTHDEAFEGDIGSTPGFPEMRARQVCDYIAGMSDRFARDRYVEHFLPSGYPQF
ncbi:MAG: deoxyguanosinetriphosphate triphosphohydrolase [candidate division WS1 bacterium]|nr:deoxyguanosinetriphosphate triphosphohydrolase [candidate division WS1 bacterium]